MQPSRTLSGLAVSLLLVACQGTGHDVPKSPAGGNGAVPDAHASASAADVEAACLAQLAAPAHQWGEHLPAVVGAGRRAEAPLLRALTERPAAPGAQAAIAALGRVGGDDAVAFCRRMVEERAPLAVEAALALAELPGAADDAALLACVQDEHSDAALRTAAACALVRHGERRHASAWIAAVVRAGTPAGRRDERELGVPTKTRWARERYFVQRTLLALGHRDLGEQLDTDAPWPTLEKLAPKVEARLRQG